MATKNRVSIPYAELLQRCDRVLSLFHRDADVFADYGLNEAFATAFSEKIELFRDTDTDRYWEGQQMMATKAKDDARKALEELLAGFRFRAKLALGEKSARFRLYGFGPFSKHKDPGIVRHAQSVVRAASNMLADLSPRGIDQAYLDDIQGAYQQLDMAIDDAEAARGTRQAKTVDRRNLAAGLYTSLGEICNIGKRHWRTLNEAHYEEYVLFGDRIVSESASE
ncbi:hypothetical protein FUAX_19970 [Fulvitalea axinellae]|uniref:Uncharacterized protein n=1 Tax=Fulvitalea axinellae TaxID=1182444 RepID=A0AAU9DF23_9BACT|nr:hypothetical protein FUAX_19970 [Fulvitalea axinellae]